MNISLTKIFNFPTSKPYIHLSIAFYSLITNTLIAKKVIKALAIDGCLSLGVNLRINYTSDQNEVLLSFLFRFCWCLKKWHLTNSKHSK